MKSFYPPKRSFLASVEQIVACTPKETTAASLNVRNDPPVLFVSKQPTILIQLEGAPKKASSGKDDIEFVINANYGGVRRR